MGMKKQINVIFLFAATIVLLTGCNNKKTEYFIYAESTNPQVINTAKDELIHYLSHLSDKPVQITQKSDSADILLYTLAQLPNSVELSEKPANPEEFVIATVNHNGRSQIIICGFDERAVLYGVYELIEHYMSRINNSPWIDISFDFERGAGRHIDILDEEISLRKVPFYKNRGIHLDFIGLGAGAMLDSDSSQRMDKEVWKRWSKWGARHRLNFITNWPYGKTNWWELVPDSVLEGATNFSPDDLNQSIDIRMQMLDYTRSFALDPYLMNYVPGKGSKEMVANFPNLFTYNHEKHVARFCYQQPELWEIFNDVIVSVTNLYPEMEGFNLRRWGESYPCECDFCIGRDTELSRQLLINMIENAKLEREDLKILLSGYADPEYAKHFPDYVTCMIKWGNDWDPSPDPGRSSEYLRSYGKKDIIIDIALPAEESFPLGLIQHTHITEGILKHALNRDEYPNLSGFAAGLGDSDIEFITELNYIIFSKLIRDPELFDLQEFVNAYLTNKFGKESAADIQESLDIQAAVWSDFFLTRERGGFEFANLAPYSNWARFGDLFVSFPNGGKNAFEWLQERSDDELNESLIMIDQLLPLQIKAYDLIINTKDQIPAKNQVIFNDYLIQTRGYLSYLQSRKALVEGFLAHRKGIKDESLTKIRMTINFNAQLIEALKDKPNNVGYGDTGGNIADWELNRAIEGIEIENNYLESLILNL
jgi:hypothetical protein